MRGSMNKFAPGPWQIRGTPYLEYWIVDADSPEQGKQNVIAQLLPHWRPNQGNCGEANARLIAAASQMFEALDELVDLKDRRHTLAIEIYQQARERAWEKCRAAIRAAKGGE